MKTNPKSLVLLLLLMFAIATAFVTSDPKDKPVDSTDEAAIRNIIHEETAAYFNRDSTKLFSYYTDDEITQCIWNSPDGSYGGYKGLHNIHKNFTTFFRKNSSPVKQPPIERTEWFFRKFSDQWMWVNFIQKTTGFDGKTDTSYETRILKKVDGQWKIAVMYALSNHGIVSKN